MPAGVALYRRRYRHGPVHAFWTVGWVKVKIRANGEPHVGGFRVVEVVVGPHVVLNSSLHAIISVLSTEAVSRTLKATQSNAPDALLPRRIQSTPEPEVLACVGVFDLSHQINLRSQGS